MPIPKTIHVIWIGDETKRPDAAIATWRDMNPSYQLRVWGNAEVQAHDWYLGDLIEAWACREINGAADILRWEILLRYGGLAFDADSACVRPLEDWLLQPDAFAVWENEIRRPSLIATGAMGFVANHFLVAAILKDIHADPHPFSAMAWQKLGPGRLTDTVRTLGYVDLTIYPSHYFLPRHFTGLEYAGSGPVFAKQFWGSTLRSYGDAMTAQTNAVTAPVADPLPPRTEPLAPSHPPVAVVPPLELVQADSGTGIVRGLDKQFYLQRMTVIDVPRRLPHIRALCAGKKVLHVGCTDHPVFNPEHNLHIQIGDVCAELDGLDTDTAGLEVLSRYVNGRYFSKVSEIEDEYDLVLVPETIEHVSGIGEFLGSLSQIKFRDIFITAPCLLGWMDCFNYKTYHGRRAGLLSHETDYIEEVHPDHKAWFTPYTLANCVEQYSDWRIGQVMFLEGWRMAAVHCSK